MIIFSNDYPTNLPGSKHHAKGGPAIFAKRFKVFLADKNSHWIGLIINLTTNKQPRIKVISWKNKCKYLRLDIPKTLNKKISRAPQKLNAEKIFSRTITLLAGLLKKTKADIVFLNGYGLSNWLILKAAEQTNIPIAIQHAGIMTKELRMYKDFYSEAGRKILERMEQEIPKIADAEIFLNDWSRKYYNANVATTAKDKTFIIPLPIDFKKYRRTGVFRKPGKIFNIGLIARWDRIKNHEAVAVLAEEARKAGLPWRFHAVTTIPDTAKKKRLKNLYRKNINVLPPLSQTGIKRFCHKMDLLIMPSHFDVSPNVVLEATGCGAPIAISPNVGFVDAFKKCGAADWIIDFNDAPKAIKKILKIAGKPMPAKLTRHIMSSHQSDKVFSAYIKLFKKIIKNK